MQQVILFLIHSYLLVNIIVFLYYFNGQMSKKSTHTFRLHPFPFRVPLVFSQYPFCFSFSNNSVFFSNNNLIQTNQPFNLFTLVNYFLAVLQLMQFYFRLKQARETQKEREREKGNKIKICPYTISVDLSVFSYYYPFDIIGQLTKKNI